MTKLTFRILNPLDARSRYTDFAQTSYTAPEVGIQAARYINATGQKPVYRICFLMRTGTRFARVIEIKTRQQLKRTRSAVPTVPGTRPATRRRRRLVTNEAAAIGWVMYADEGPYTFDICHVEEMMGTTREAVDGDIVRRGRDGDETGDETGGPGDETGDGW